MKSIIALLYLIIIFLHTGVLQASTTINVKKVLEGISEEEKWFIRLIDVFDYVDDVASV